MNYFNYFTEIEEEFVKRRGSHLLVSPLDWSLMEVWKQQGIPLHVVLRGINNSFDGYDERARRGRKVNSLFYCQQEVEALFLEYCDSRVGSGEQDANENSDATNGQSEASTPFTRISVIDYLAESLAVFRQLQTRHAGIEFLRDTFERVSLRLEQILEDLQNSKSIAPEALETDLTMIEEVILDGMKEGIGQEQLKEIKQEGQQKLRAYKKGMGPEIYQKTLDNFIAQKLRERFGVPRLSLFYL